MDSFGRDYSSQARAHSFNIFLKNYLSSCVHGGCCVCLNTCGDQKTTLRNWVSFSTLMCVLGIEIRWPFPDIMHIKGEFNFIAF